MIWSDVDRNLRPYMASLGYSELTRTAGIVSLIFSQTFDPLKLHLAHPYKNGLYKVARTISIPVLSLELLYDTVLNSAAL